jgi:hypothetical protein
MMYPNFYDPRESFSSWHVMMMIITILEIHGDEDVKSQRIEGVKSQHRGHMNLRRMMSNLNIESKSQHIEGVKYQYRVR